MAGRILLIEAVSSQRILTASALRRARYAVVAVESGAEALRAVQTEPPDLVLLGAVPGDTAALATALSESGRFGDTPILILDTDATPERRLAALKAGARDLVRRPSSEALLLARARCLLREGETLRERARRHRAAQGLGLAESPAPFSHRARIAYVATTAALPISLARPGHEIAVIAPDAALDICDPAKAPDAYILNAAGPGRDAALALLPELRARAHSRHAAMLVLHDADDGPAAIAALDTGAGDLMPSDGGASELAHRLATLLRRKADRDALRRSTETSLRLAATDPLTGLYNRRYAEAYLVDATHQAQADGQGLAVLLLDADHFKAINDRHGHAAGDEVLRTIAGRLRENLRGTDLIARFGGEEFLVVLPETATDQAGPAADRLRDEIARRPVTVDGTAISVTVSIGVAVGTPAAAPTDPRDLVEAADRALYRAKEAGRNRIEIAPAQSALAINGAASA